MISENTITTTDGSDILKNDELLADHFWVNFFGFVSLYNEDPTNSKIVHYLRKDKVQVLNITPDNGDLTYIIKLLYDSKKIPNQKITILTKFLALMKQGKIKKIDENLFRDLINQINILRVRPNNYIKNLIENFLKGVCGLSDKTNLKNLFRHAKKEKIGAEFIEIARHVIPKIEEEYALVVIPDVKKDVIANNTTIVNTQTSVVDVKKDVPVNDTPVVTTQTLVVVRTGTEMFSVFKEMWGKTQSEISAIFNKYDWKFVNIKDHETFLKQMLSSEPIESGLLSTGICAEIGKKNFYPESLIDTFIPYIFSHFNTLKSVEFIIANYVLHHLQNSSDFFQKIKKLFSVVSSGLEDYRFVYKTMLNLIMEKMKSDFHIWLKNILLLRQTTYEHFIIDLLSKNVKLLPDLDVLDFFKRNKSNFSSDYWISIQKFYKNYSSIDQDVIAKTLPYDQTPPPEEKKPDYGQIFLSSIQYSTPGEVAREIYNLMLTKKITNDEFFEIIDSILIQINSDFLVRRFSNFIAVITDIWKWNLDENKKMKAIAEKFFIQGGISDNYNYSHLIYQFSDFNFFLNNHNLFFKVKPDFYMFMNRCEGVFRSFKGFNPHISLFHYEQKLFDLFYAEFPTEVSSIYGDLQTFLIDNFQNDKMLFVGLDSFLEKVEIHPFTFKDRFLVFLENAKNGQELYAKLEDAGVFKDSEERSILNIPVSYHSSSSASPDVLFSQRETKRFLRYFENPTDKEFEIFLEMYKTRGEMRSVFERNPLVDFKLKSEIYKKFLDNYPKFSSVFATSPFLFHETNREIPEDIQKEITISEIRICINWLKEFGEVKKTKDITLWTERRNNLNRRSTAIQTRDTLSEKLMKLCELGEDDLMDDFFDGIDSKNATLIKNRIMNSVGLAPVYTKMTEPNSPIPLEKISQAKIFKLLGANNFDVKEVLKDRMPRKKKSQSFSSHMKNIKEEVKKILDEKIELKVTNRKKDEYVLIDETLELAKTLSTDRAHGDYALKVVECFDVNLEFDEFKAFQEKHPDSKLYPAFHGSSTVNAAFILRFGFKIFSKAQMKSSDIGFVGRTMGDGIYFAINTDKNTGYIREGDNYQRGLGNTGVLFECEVLLGDENRDYVVGGRGMGRLKHYRSVEYSVFDPKAQIRIKKAYRVVVVKRSWVESLMKDNKKKMKPFSQFVVETKPLKNPKYMTVSQIDKEIDSLDKQSSVITDKFIEAGRGHERPSEYLKKMIPYQKRQKEFLIVYMI